MIILWTTQCPSCGPLLVRAAQPVKPSSAFAFGETWCGLCGEPVVEILQRKSEEGDPGPSEITGLLAPGGRRAKPKPEPTSVPLNAQPRTP
jgi:hypothetical protein